MTELLQYLHRLDADARALLEHGVRILVVVLLAVLVQGIASRLIRTLRSALERRREPTQAGRIRTLGRVSRYISSGVVWLVAGTLVLSELGISVAPVLATAGVAGLAIGFGAQSLVKDYFTGFFLLLEDQIREGDVVTIAGENGLVEEVTLRYVRIRNFEGHVSFVPNGEIKIVKNHTREFAHALVDVGVGYGENLDEALEVMREVGRGLRADPDFGPLIAADTEIVGVEAWEDSAVRLRCRLKVVPPIEQWNVRREFLKRLKVAYDARGIEIPFPQLTLHPGRAKDGPALDLRVVRATEATARGARPEPSEGAK